MTTIRCAIYTRKSNEEGLDKTFNTLQAQREAGENFVKSQVHQGWELVDKHYDDGGFSGGNMNRPVLQDLMADIKDGKVGMIVVYKIDRLTRSLIDFSKMIEVLDKHQCSFVSVTQNFNTADSMGRLMLNVLLSFAQFEREISGERIRDKIAASKKKGMWMGGRLPLGYGVKDKKLFIKPDEAKIVRRIFELYPVHKSALIVMQILNDEHIPVDVKRIESVLRNPIYMGKIGHKGKLYDGVHPAIITADEFDMAQHTRVRKNKSIARRYTQSVNSHPLLHNMMQCACCGTSMIPHFSKKNNARYHYYISYQAKKYGSSACKMGYIPVTAMDDLALKIITPIVASPAVLQELSLKAAQICKKYQEPEIFELFQSPQDIFNQMSPLEKHLLLEKLIDKIHISNETVRVVWSQVASELMSKKMKSEMVDGTTIYPITFKRHRGQIRIILPEMTEQTMHNRRSVKLPEIKHDKILVQALARAFKYKEMMIKRGVSIAELATQEKSDRGYIGRQIRMSYLAPDIVEGILSGTQPACLTLYDLMRSDIPHIWADQRKKYGFAEVGEKSKK